MNTNQDTKLTNQDVMLDLYKIHAYIPNDAAGNPLTPFGNFCEGYQAATKASESEINSLKQHVEELEAEVVKAQDMFKCLCIDTNIEQLELTASNNKLREALERIIESYQYEASSENPSLLNAFKVLESTPAQSLAEHDNEEK